MSRRRAGMFGVLGSIIVVTILATTKIVSPGAPRDLSAMTQAGASQAQFTEQAATAPNDSERPNNYPAFAPDGVIIVRAPDTRAAIVHEGAERVEVYRTAERGHRVVRGPRLRANEAPSEPSSGSAGDAGERRVSGLTQRRATADAPPSDLAPREAIAEADEFDDGPGSIEIQENDTRSWYRSPAYWREVEQRRRAQQRSGR